MTAGTSAAARLDAPTPTRGEEAATPGSRLTVGGRPLRVLHVGNIGNNAYQNARILRAAGVSSDVLCYDYYHVMGCPEWEDGELSAAPRGVDEDFPDWSGVRVTDFVRPRWFAQGPLRLAARYLRARAEGATVRERVLWAALEGSRRLLSRRAVRTAALAGLTLVRQGQRALRATARAAAGAPAATPAGLAWAQRFADAFPERADRLTEQDLAGRAGASARALRTLFAGYDVVIGYSTDAALPMLAGHPCFLAFEHGTLRAIPFEDSARGRLTALSYRLAARAFVTNCDNVRAVERLRLANARYVPHPMNDALLAAADGRDLRRELEQRYGADFVVFHPSRHHWQPERHPDWEKGNDILLHGFARFVKESAPRALLVLVRWGRTVRESEALLRAAGVSDRVLWIELVSNRAMLRYIKAADAVADQFWLGTFGGIMPKAMAAGRPVLLHLDPTVHSWCFPELPPHLPCRTPEDVSAALSMLHRDAAAARALGERSRQWYQAYHSEASIRDRLLAALGESLDGRAGASATVTR